MARVVLVRLAWMLPILLGVSVVAFVLMRALPGDFAQASAGTTELTPEALETIRRSLGLDRPVWEQYLHWLGRILSGDFGDSFVTHKPVLGELLPRLAVTAQLTLMAGLLAMLMGATSGLLSARLRGRTDWVVRGLNGLMLAVPNFVVATLIVLLAGLYFPEIGIFNYTPFLTDPLANLGSLLLPAISLALAVSVTISENTRAAVLEVSSQDFVMVARAKGLHRRTILLHQVLQQDGAQCAHAGHHRDRPAAGLAAGRQHPDRDHLHHPRHGAVPVRFDQQPRLPGDPGHRAGGGHDRAADERAGRHRLCTGGCPGLV